MHTWKDLLEENGNSQAITKVLSSEVLYETKPIFSRYCTNRFFNTLIVYIMISSQLIYQQLLYSTLIFLDDKSVKYLKVWKMSISQVLFTQ